MRVYLGRDGNGKRQYRNERFVGKKRDAEKVLVAMLRARDDHRSAGLPMARGRGCGRGAAPIASPLMASRPSHSRRQRRPQRPHSGSAPPPSSAL